MSEQRDLKPCFGGPFAGTKVARASDSILLTGDGVPEGQVARYRFSVGADGYLFKGLDTIVAQIDFPRRADRLHEQAHGELETDD